MDNPFDIVKDSSIWLNKRSFKAANQLDSILYTGTVRSVLNDSASGELRYMVEIHHRGDTIPTPCRMVRRFGGAFNYEDVVMRGYNYNTPAGIAAKSGDLVLVGLIGGQGREGVILGGLTHPTRPNLKKDNGPEYKSEFNGIETYINKDGEYTLTFRAQPTNLSALDSDPNGPVPAPKYDTDVGSSYLKFDKTGGIMISDAAKTQLQKIYLDKKNGTIELASGTVSIKMDKNAQSITYNTSQFEGNASSSIRLNTPAYVLSSPDIKLGGDLAIQQAVHGTIYRAQELIMNSVLSVNLVSMGVSLTAAGAALSSAAVDPLLAAIAPAAAALIAAAGVAVTAAGANATAMAAGISTFEASSPLYLSNVVKVL